MKPNFTRDADVVVGGGGLAGLTAAALVARAGRSVVVLEQATHPGGRAATHVRGGVHFNLGPHALYCHGHAFRLLRELRVPFTGRVPPGGRPLLLTEGAAHTLPTGLGSLLASRLLTLREKWRFARLLTCLAKYDARPQDRVPLGQWVRETAGTGNLARVLHTFFSVATYADDPDRLSAGAALDQLKLAVAGNVWYLDGGWQTIVDGLRARAAEHGAEVRTGERVRSVDPDGDGVTVRTDRGVIRGRTAILAAGPKAVTELLRLPSAAPLVRWAARAVPVKVACLDVALARLPRPEHLVAFGLDRPLYYSVHSASAKLAPDGVAVIHVMKYLGNDAAPAEAVGAELEGVLDRLQPGWRGHVVERRFLPGMTVAHALPRADEGGTSGRPGVELPERPGVFLAGDWVGPDGQLGDAAAASAERAARLALEAVARTPDPARRLSHAGR
jgi:phytoene dehydrogenase-like protein